MFEEEQKDANALRITGVCLVVMLGLMSLRECQIPVPVVTPTPTATAGPTWTEWMTWTPEPTGTATPSATPTAEPTVTETAVPTASATERPTVTPAPSNTVTAEPTATRTRTATRTSTKTATRSATPSPTLVPTPTPEGGAQEGIRAISPVVFVMGDWDNLDYATLHPDWPALGGVMSFEWDDLYPGGTDAVDWGVIDRYIRQAQGYRVTLHDGRVIPKPVAFGVDVATMDGNGTLHFPAYVADKCGPDLAYTYDPDGAGDCPAYSVPNYSNTCWRQEWLRTIAAMGQHYDNNPAFGNLEWVKMSLGWDEEAVCWKVMGRYDGQVCDYTGGPSAGFDAWVGETVRAYNQAFPHLTNMAQMTMHSTVPYGDIMATFDIKSTGIKNNGWEYDPEGARILYGEQAPELVGGIFGYGERWHELLPVGYEPAGSWWDWQNSYWAWMNALVAHPDLVDIQYDLIAATTALEDEIGWPVMDFGLAHLGVTLEDTPDVWIAFRETRREADRWCAVPSWPYAVDCTRGDVPDSGTFKAYEPWYGPLEFWLYEVRDRALQSYTYRTANLDEVQAYLPQPARDHPYAANSMVRTDQASGQRYVLLNIADGYADGARAVTAGGSTAWTVVATVVNKGTDRLALQYFDTLGKLQQRSVTKGTAALRAQGKWAALGVAGGWTDLTWTLLDADMANWFTGGGDLRLDCLADGDEVITRVVVSRREVEPVLQGLATWYGGDYVGRTMRNGEVYTAKEHTAAVSGDLFEQLQNMQLLVCVDRDENQNLGTWAQSPRKCIRVQVTDSGDAVEFEKYGVVLDLSEAAFLELAGDLEVGSVRVKVWPE